MTSSIRASVDIANARAGVAHIIEGHNRIEACCDRVREHIEVKVVELATAKDQLRISIKCVAKIQRAHDRHVANEERVQMSLKSSTVELNTAIQQLRQLVTSEYLHEPTTDLGQYFTIHPELGHTDTFFDDLWTYTLGDVGWDMVSCVMWYRTRCQEIQCEMNLAQRCTDSLATGGNPYETESHEEIYLLVSKYGYVNSVSAAADIEPLIARALAFHKGKLEEAQDELFIATLQEVNHVNAQDETYRVQWSLLMNISPIITTVKCFIVSGTHGFINVHADGYIDCQVHLPHV